MKKYLSIIITLGIIIVVFPSPPSLASTIDQPAPDFTLKSLQGKNLKLSELAGNVILVNFWASWCGPCRKEMPLLNDLHNKYKNLGFIVLGVNVEEEVDNAKSFIADSPVDFPILFDSKNDVSKLYDIIAMPTSAIIDRNGTLRYLHQGYKDGDEKKYREMARKLLRE